MKGQEYLGFNTIDFTQYMQDFIPGMQISQNRDGIVLLIAKPFANYDTPNKKYLENRVFISTDKSKLDFHQLSVAGHSSTTTLQGEIAHYLLKNPHGSEVVSSDLYLDRGSIFMVVPRHERKIDPADINKMELWPEGLEPVLEEYMAFTLMERDDYSWLKVAKFHPLPEIRRKEYYLKMEDGTIFYVDALKHNFSYETMRLFTGLREIHEVKINNITRARDGGTTFIYTNEGRLFVPSKMLGKQLKPTWTRDGSKDPQDLFEPLPKLIHVVYVDGFPNITELVETY